MSIERENGLVFIACDSCGEASDPFQDFSDAMDAWKNDGGRSVRVGGEWANLCAACFPERDREIRR